MIVRVGNGGQSFKGMDQYFGHDKEAMTKERVAWTHTLNMLTDDPDKAWRVMAYTAMEQKRLKMASGQKGSGNKLKKPVFAYTLAWHPEHELTEEHIRETALKSLEKLDLMDYQVVMYRHRDEPQPHVHIIVNRVHPQTGLAVDLPNSERRLSDFARIYERENGKIYCKQREENYRKRQEGKRAFYADPNIVEAWNAAADGKSFAAELEKRGYRLANGRKRIVVVDRNGKIHNPARHLHGVRASDIRQKLGQVTLASLFDASSLSNEIRAEQKREYLAQRKGGPSVPAPEAPRPVPTPAMINRLQDRHLEERRELYNGQHDKMDAELDKLKEYYQIRERRQSITELRNKTTNPSWWRTLLGKTRRDRELLKAEVSEFRQVDALIKDRMKFLERQREEAMAKQTIRHEQEKVLLYERGTDNFHPEPVRVPKVQKSHGPDFTR